MNILNEITTETLTFVENIELPKANTDDYIGTDTCVSLCGHCH